MILFQLDPLLLWATTMLAQGGVALADGKKISLSRAGPRRRGLRLKEGQVFRVAIMRHMSFANDFMDEL